MFVEALVKCNSKKAEREIKEKLKIKEKILVKKKVIQHLKHLNTYKRS